MPPRQAIAKVLKPLTDRGPESFIFPGSGKAGFLSENTLCKALRSLGFDGATAHGLRSLLTDQLYEAMRPVSAKKLSSARRAMRGAHWPANAATNCALQRFVSYLAMFLWRPHG